MQSILLKSDIKFMNGGYTVECEIVIDMACAIVDLIQAYLMPFQFIEREWYHI